MTDSIPEPAGGEDRRKAAYNLFISAWNSCVEQEIPLPDMATAAISTTLIELISVHGEDAVANMVEAWPGRIRAGEFTPKPD